MERRIRILRLAENTRMKTDEELNDTEESTLLRYDACGLSAC